MTHPLWERLSKCEDPREVVRKGVGRLELLEMKLGTHPQRLSESRPRGKERLQTKQLLSVSELPEERLTPLSLKALQLLVRPAQGNHHFDQHEVN